MAHLREPPFFIVSCARSGSTSLCAILGTAENGVCASEPVPNLGRESRLAMDGRLGSPRRVVEQTVVPRVRAGQAQVEVYGEKNVTYGPFLHELHELLDCRFVFLTRDGRDVVRSLINWHEEMWGNIYRECRETGVLSSMALHNAASLLIGDDSADFARPRPGLEDPLCLEWERLSRAEMCAYYWSHLNGLIQDGLEALPTSAWTRLDYSRVSVDEILRVADFCHLRGLVRGRVQTMLERRINSLADRGAERGTCPDWRSWDSGARRRFDRIAAPAMRRLGYYSDVADWRPSSYGRYWDLVENPTTWYQEIYDSRRPLHDAMFAWIRGRASEGEPIASVLELGSGLGVGYADAFADCRYVGVDLSARCVAWCREHRGNPRHTYHCADFVAFDLGERFDLVFSSGTLDNCYDIDLALRTMVAHANRWIYATFYRGWFPELAEHRYRWNPAFTSFDADVSPSRLHAVLNELGCRNIEIHPVRAPADGRGNPYETRLIAAVGASR